MAVPLPPAPAWAVVVTLLSLAAWLSLRDRSPLLRLAVGSLAAVLLFLAHIVPLMVYAAAIAGYEVQRLTIEAHGRCEACRTA